MNCRIKSGNDDVKLARAHSQGSLPGAASMALKLFELVGTDEARPFSPYCWRTRMALAHKGLGAEALPWLFTEKAALRPHQADKVPVLLDGDAAIVDSWTIAN